ncbi:MFS transporter [Brevibacillus dissolubilis]|uniref:MFS transporter n=1 Tax=Brevibacillus dissolubilis TaxID=1844116 RepID=UPI0011171287|nr:MFS transporter [Brevibacillus dissolubilis]
MSKQYGWLLFIILFLASFDMHAQMPLLSPYLKELGTSAMMMGILLGAYSITNLIGNMTAGPFLDRYSKKNFIAIGLMIAGGLLVAHGLVNTSKELLGLRLTYGYVMAFVGPAASALLGQLGRTEEEQGKVMAKKGIVLTSASIISPAAGGFLAAEWGYAYSFVILGGLLILTGLFAMIALPRERYQMARGASSESNPPKEGKRVAVLDVFRLIFTMPALYPALLTGFAVMYAQGTAMYEIPLLIQQENLDPSVTGLVFSAMGIGSLVVLSQFWLNRVSPVIRCSIGLFQLGLVIYALAINMGISLYILMFFIGMSFGILFPAMTTVLLQKIPRDMYGTAFSLFSGVLSVGAIISPIIAGANDNVHSSFFFAFCILMATSAFCLMFQDKKTKATRPVTR